MINEEKLKLTVMIDKKELKAALNRTFGDEFKDDQTLIKFLEKYERMIGAKLSKIIEYQYNDSDELYGCLDTIAMKEFTDFDKVFVRVNDKIVIR